MRGLTAPHLIASIRQTLAKAAKDAGLTKGHPYSLILDIQEWVAVETIAAAADVGPVVAAATEYMRCDVRAAVQECRRQIALDRQRHDLVSRMWLRRWAFTALAVQLSFNIVSMARWPSATPDKPSTAVASSGLSTDEKTLENQRSATPSVDCGAQLRNNPSESR